jgi:hypothetical protein
MAKFRKNSKEVFEKVGKYGTFTGQGSKQAAQKKAKELNLKVSKGTYKTGSKSGVSYALFRKGGKKESMIVINNRSKKGTKDKPIKEGKTWFAPKSKGSFKRIKTGTGQKGYMKAYRYIQNGYKK